MKKVLIVGGGLAGLTSAYYLSKSGKFDIKVLEKEPELGGRVKSIAKDGINFDLGGFIVMSWYKEFHNLCDELGIEQNLQSFQNFKEYYFDSNNKFVNHPLNKPNLTEYIKYGTLLLRMKLSGKLDFYNPNYSIFNGQTAKEYMDTELGKNSEFFDAYNKLVEGYTYGDLSITPMSILAPFIFKMATGYFDKAKVLSGNTKQLVDSIENKIKEKGVEIICDCNVIDKKDKKVITTKGEFEYDYLVLATTLNESIVKQSIGIEHSTKYTEYSCVIVKMKAPTSINVNDKWFISYIPKDRGIKISSIYNQKGVSNEYDSNYLVLFVKGATDFNNLRDELKVLFPENDLLEVIANKKWSELMPIVTDELLIKIGKLQGQNNIYFAGDYFSWPLMETAIYSGKKVANLIIEKIN